MGNTSLLNVPLVGPTITITVTYTNDIRGYACPNTVHQPFLIVLAKDLFGLFLV
jgi:hypothetical protein